LSGDTVTWHLASWHLARQGEPADPDRCPAVEPGTIVIFSDLSCAFAHLCVHRLHEARLRMGADVRFVHRPFVLEEINEFPIPKHFLDSEVPQIAPLDITAGWRVWTEPPETWPVSTLLAMEAVQAAAEQSPAAHEQLDRALRRAFFDEHRCITMRHVVLEVAETCSAVDVDHLAGALDAGSCRASLMETFRAAREFVQGSPQLFFADGASVHNPGVDVTWHGDQGTGYPAVSWSDPTIHESLIRRALG
jgi:predicted DsbA family dithiol-disulfide isomerase